jgi:hypothetical protein
VSIRDEIRSTYDTAQDIATKRILVPQPKVGQNSRFVLRYGVAGDRGVGSCVPNKVGDLLMKASDRSRFVRMRKVHGRRSLEFCRLPTEELCDRTRAVLPYCLLHE